MESNEVMLVPFTEKEIAATLALVDLAAKAGGLQVSEACAELLRKLRSAINEHREQTASSNETEE